MTLDSISEQEGEEALPVAASRGRSTIAFPYFDLEEGVRIAGIVHDNYGGRCDLDQLAASLNQKAASGGFRLKVSAARLFGLVTTAGQSVSVTDLGSDTIDDRSGIAARTTAFFNAPLYQALFDRFRGRTLPNDKGLEGAIRDLGVSEKQITTARQAFQRSAEYAGFFAHGRDRLVMPAMGKMGMEPEPQGTETHAERHDEGPEIMNHPLIVGLLGALPKPGDDFPEEDRELWLQAAKVNLQLIYGKSTATSAQAASSRVFAEIGAVGHHDSGVGNT